MSGTLDDLCPICGEPVKDGDEWSIVEGVIAHVACADKHRPDDLPSGDGGER